MGNVLVEESSLSAIADAIRDKLSVQTTYKPSQMAAAIETISGGSTINNQDKTVHPSASQQTIEADSGYTGLGEVTVKAVTVENLSAANIVSGVTVKIGDADDDDSIASVTGTASSGGITPTGTKQISITENGTTIEDVTNYASAEITANVSGGGGSTVSYTRYTLTGDTNIRNFLDSAQYQIKNPDALAICIMIRVSGTAAPSGGSYTMNNYVMLFSGTTRLYAQHRYQSGAKTPDSFPSLPSVNENNTNLAITNGILTSSASATSTSCIGSAGDVVTIAEMPIPVDNTIMEGGAI